MKKIFTLLTMAFLAVSVNALETLPWEGEVVFDNWSSSLMVDKSVFASAKAGDKIMITAAPVEVSSWQWGAQVYLKTLRGGWAMICDNIAATEAKTYSVEITDDEIEIEEEKEDKSKVTVKTTMLSELKEYGLAIQGMASKITKVELYSAPEYEETGTSLEFNEWGQIFKSQLADYSGNDKIVITYKIEGSTDYEEGGSTGSVIGWNIGKIESLGGNVKLADLAVKAVGEYSISFTMNELADALDDTNTQYNTNGFGVQFWSCKNATGSVVSIIAYKVKASVEEKTYSVIGTINGNWDTDTDMTKGADSKYSVTFKNVAAGDYEFKVRIDHSWNENYGADGKLNGVNIKITVKTAGDVTITFDPETKEITYTGAEAYTIPEDATYSVIGTINGNWNTDTDMTKGSDGVYTATFNDVAAGTYKLKVRVNHDWTTCYGSGDDNDGNTVFDVAKDGSTVIVTFNPEDKKITVTVTPATGITAVKAAQQDGVRYNLAGQKVNAGYKGVVIENGKKFVVK